MTREHAIELVTKKIESGEPLTEREVREYLRLSRDHNLLLITKDTLQGILVAKARVRTFNALQNAVERHELMHPEATPVSNGVGNSEGITVGYEIALPVPGKARKAVAVSGEKVEA
jgi:hypothetical protein